MKHSAALLLTLALAAGCATTPKSATEDFVPLPQPDVSGPSTDAKLDQLQTSLTEMLERLDVLSDRMSKLETAEGTAAVVQPASAPRVVATPTAPAASAAAAERTPEPVAAVTEPAAAPAAAAPMTTDRALRGAQLADTYRNALMLYGKGRVAESRAAFQQIFDTDPTGELADNALYWIGETYFAAGDFANAMRFYTRVTKEFAEQNKAPDAMFKLGLTYEKTGDLGVARQTFEETIRRYPYSTPAASAKLELKRIKY
jgi:tol-pal system protein YbgF